MNTPSSGTARLSGYHGQTVSLRAKLHGVEYDRHNTSKRTGLTELRRASLLAGHLDEAARLTTAQQRGLYLRIRELWARVEADRLALEAAAQRERERTEPVLYPTGGCSSTVRPPGNG